MMTTIEMRWVAGVLLADGWYVIHPGSFRIEDYEFVEAEGADQAVPPQKGYHFDKVDQVTRDVLRYAGPISSVLGVRYSVPTELVIDD